MKENKRLEKIKEVYGDKYSQYSPNEEGWVRFSGRRYSDWHNACEYKEWLGYHFYRPKELTGIEENNGWCRTDEDFPDKNGIYVFITKNDIQHEVLLRFPLSKEEENHFKNDFTHFRVPKHHPLPIY